MTEMFMTATATPKGIFGKWTGNRELNPDQYIQAINIFPTGIVHFVATNPLIYQRGKVRFYGFVSLIGYLWQLIYLIKAIHKNIACSCNVAIILNFSGAKGTILADLAKGPNKIWIDAFHWLYNDDPRKINQENNFQVYRELQLPDSSDEQIEGIIRDVSEEIGNYYNQPTPQCFTPDTNEFPVQQYLQTNNW